ncbi:MAG: hypothetical protein FJZ96_11620 [Chloroflexi bacterium]|nr:hypothetical protein [Chloroflexota bacterium]
MGSSNSHRGGFLAALLEFFQALFPPKPAAPPPVPPPVVPSDNTSEPVRVISSRVLLIIYDPVMDPASGEKLSEKMHWRRADELAAAFSAEALEASSGMAKFQVAQRIEINEFPRLADGFRYTPSAYMDVLRGGRPHEPVTVDYEAIRTGFNLLEQVANGDIDEVWVFGFPYAGFYESAMGGAGAFWCNAPPLANTASCKRRFVIMGFSYERGIGEMLESFGHRAESILEKTYARTSGEANLYKRFTRYDKAAPGQAEVGNIHFAPNSERDYDWGNMRKVPSRCDDWLRFPAFEGLVREVDASEWGGGDMRLHHRWWFERLPKVAGRSAGVAHNWWQYIMDPNLVNL